MEQVREVLLEQSVVVELARLDRVTQVKDVRARDLIGRELVRTIQAPHEARHLADGEDLGVAGGHGRAVAVEAAQEVACALGVRVRVAAEHGCDRDRVGVAVDRAQRVGRIPVTRAPQARIVERALHVGEREGRVGRSRASAEHLGRVEARLPRGQIHVPDDPDPVLDLNPLGGLEVDGWVLQIVRKRRHAAQDVAVLPDLGRTGLVGRGRVGGDRGPPDLQEDEVRSVGRSRCGRWEQVDPVARVRVVRRQGERPCLGPGDRDNEAVDVGPERGLQDELGQTQIVGNAHVVGRRPTQGERGRREADDRESRPSVGPAGDLDGQVREVAGPEKRGEVDRTIGQDIAGDRGGARVGVDGLGDPITRAVQLPAVLTTEVEEVGEPGVRREGLIRADAIAQEARRHRSQVGFALRIRLDLLVEVQLCVQRGLALLPDDRLEGPVLRTQRAADTRSEVFHASPLGREGHTLTGTAVSTD